MKKLLIGFAFMGLFTFLSPKNINAEDNPCHAIVITCPDGTSYNIIYCDHEDYWTWAELLCGVPLT